MVAMGRLSLPVAVLLILQAARPAPTHGAERPISRLYLFVHCLGGQVPAETRREYADRWRDLFAREAVNPQTAVCFLSSGAESLVVADAAREAFGDRCIVDPRDNGEATQLLMVRDLQLAFRDRGMNGEWTPYEMWTSTEARRLSEGLKAEFRARGLTIDPERTRILACGRAWGGCLAKYSAFMSRYLGLSTAAEMLPDLSPGAGTPVAAAFRESLPLGRHVRLYLFETADGRPIGQFFDGLRGVAEAPHVAAVEIDRARVQLLCVPPNGSQRPQPVPNPLASGPLLVDVADGCRPVFTTVIGSGINYAEFKAALASARIEPMAPRHDSQTQFAVPATVSPRGPNDAP